MRESILTIPINEVFEPREPAYERWYDYYISKRGEGVLNEAEQEYISFIVKIANWNVSIHNLPEFDRERAFHDWFLTHDPNK